MSLTHVSDLVLILCQLSIRFKPWEGRSHVAGAFVSPTMPCRVPYSERVLNEYLFMNDWKDFQRSFGPTLSLKTRRMRPREESDWPVVTLLLRSKSSGCDPDFRTHVPVLFLLNRQKVNRETGQIFFKLPMESGLNGRCNHRTWFLDLFSCIYFAMCLLSKQERPAPLGKWLIH